MSDPRKELKGQRRRPNTKQDAVLVQELEQDDPEVRIAIRVPADIHEQIRRHAKEERLSVNQAIVQAIERFSGSPNSGKRQEIRDLVDICRIFGTELTPQLKRALTDRVKAVYGLDLPVDFCCADSAAGGEGDERLVG